MTAAEASPLTDDDLLFDLDVQIVAAAQHDGIYNAGKSQTPSGIECTEWTCSSALGSCSCYTCHWGMAPNMCHVP
jgi:hypothetical protein